LIKNKLIAGGTNDGKIILLEQKSLALVRTLQIFKKPIYCLLWERNRNVLIAGQYNKIVIWNYSNGQVIKVLTGHHRALMKLTFFEDKNLLGSFGYDNKLSLWDLEKGLNVKSFLQTDFQRNSILAMIFHYYASVLYLPERKKFVCYYFNNEIKIRDAALLIDEAGGEYFEENIN
jgi:WD40 repeat protein